MDITSTIQELMVIIEQETGKPAEEIRLPPTVYYSFLDELDYKKYVGVAWSEETDELEFCGIPVIRDLEIPRGSILVI